MSPAMRRLLQLGFSVCLLTVCIFSQAQVYVGGVQTAVGSPESPWQGPVGVASDTGGNIYIAEYQAQSYVEKIDVDTHQVTTLIPQGASLCGLSLSYTQGLAADSSNNLYIADQGHARVLVYSLATSTCTASYNVTSPFAVAVDSVANIWVTTDIGASSAVSKIPAGSVSGTAATSVVTSGLQSATGLNFDGNGNLYVSDQAANTVYEYTASSSYTTQTTFVSSSNGSDRPYGIVFDAQQNLYVAEAGSNEVLKYVAPEYTTYYPVTASAYNAEGVGLDSSGNLYLTAYLGKTVTEVSLSSGNFGRVNLGDARLSSVNFEVINGTAVGSFRIVDQGQSSVEFTEQTPDTNASLCSTGSAAYGSNTACSLNVNFTPSHPGQRLGAVQALSPQGEVLATAYLSGTGLAPMAGFSPATSNVLAVSGLGTPISGPRRPALDPIGNLYLADLNNNRVLEIAPNGSSSVIATAGYPLSGPVAVALDGAGSLYIDNITGVIKVDSAGAVSQLNNNALSFSLVGIAVDAAGNVYGADSANNRVIEWPNGGLAKALSISGVTLSNPRDVASDASGNLYVVDANNNRVVKVTASGVGSVVDLGSLTLNAPRAVALDAAENLYISDSGNNRVVQVLAGSGATAVNLDSLTLDSPIGVAVSGAGDLYIMDAGNNRIVLGKQSAAPALSFATSYVGSLSSDSPKTFTLLNLGNQSLSLASSLQNTLPADGSSFATDAGTTTCETSLDPSSSCVYGLNFTPAGNGPQQGTLTLTDNNLDTSGATQTVNVSGTGVQITLTPSTLPAATVASAYSGTLLATGGTGPYTYSTVSGTLPAGLTLNSAGSLAGTPGAAGTYTFSVKATDSSNAPGPFSATASYTLTVNKAVVAAVVVTSSANPVFSLTPVTLQATVNATVTAPTGSVNFFFDQTTLIGTGQLTNGVASFTTTTLASGSHTISASYSGDANFLTATSNAVPELVQDFTLSVTSAASHSIPPSGTTSYTFTLTPTFGSALPAAVNLSVSGLPPGATYALSQQTAASGSGATVVQLSLTAAQATAAYQPGKSMLLPVLSLLLLPFSKRVRKAAGKLGGLAVVLLLLAGTLGGLASLTGCASRNGFLGQAQQDYTVTLTGTSGALSHSATVQTTVE